MRPVTSMGNEDYFASSTHSEFVHSGVLLWPKVSYHVGLNCNLKDLPEKEIQPARICILISMLELEY